MQSSYGKFSSPPPVKAPADNNDVIIPETHHCQWRISATHGEKIVLNVTSLDIPQVLDCAGDYLEVRDGHWRESTLLGKVVPRYHTPPPPRPPPIAIHLFAIYIVQ